MEPRRVRKCWFHVEQLEARETPSDLALGLESGPVPIDTASSTSVPVRGALLASGGLGSSKADVQSVPFKGVADAVITGAVQQGDETHLTVSATGRATHLGEFTRTESLVLAGGVVTGTVVFTAANGDQLHADVAGGFTSPTTVAGTYTFTGGTGRFADATGVADFAGVTADGAHFTITFDGSIAY
jgi:hypothetical protein